MFTCANIPWKLQEEPEERDELLQTHLTPTGQLLELKIWKHPNSWTMKKDDDKGIENNYHLEVLQFP